MADKGVMPTEKMDSSKILGTFTFKPMDDVAWYVSSPRPPFSRVVRGRYRDIVSISL